MLIDTGTSKNFIQPLNCLLGVTALKHAFNVNSINGTNEIKEKCEMILFGYRTTFYILPSLKKFDGIIGCDFLKEIQAIVDIGRDSLSFKKGNVPLLYEDRNVVNQINVDSEDVSMHIQKDFEDVLISNANAFADP